MNHSAGDDLKLQERLRGKFAGQERASELFKKYIALVVLLLLIIISSTISDAFFTQKNLSNLLRQLSGTTIVSMGMLLVILTGGIDLSVGSVVALSGVLFAYFATFTSLPVALLLTFFFAALCGMISGYFSAFQNMAPFVVTLAMMSAARGIAYIVSRGTPIPIQSRAVSIFGQGSLYSIPFPVITALLVFVVIAFLLRYTSFGRFVQAIGSNETAVRLSGIRVNYYKWMVYTISGFLCAFAGIISDGRTGVGSPTIGSGMEMDAIAACVIGGASLSGGRGTAINTLVGVLILGLIGNIMNLMNVAGYPQQVIKGIIIIVAVLLQGSRKKN